MTASEMITISNKANENAENALIDKLETLIRNKAKLGKTNIAVPKLKMKSTIYKHFEERGFTFNETYIAGMCFVQISWANATPLNDKDFKFSQIEERLENLNTDF